MIKINYNGRYIPVSAYLKIEFPTTILKLKQSKMKAYKQTKHTKTLIRVNDSYKGEPLEAKIRRIMSNKEPIGDSAPLIYTERKEGVRPEHDIRTDRFDVALDMTDKISKHHAASRDMRLGEKSYDTMTTEQQTEFNKKYPKNKFANKQSEDKSGA